jgi:hypothetical protein
LITLATILFLLFAVMPPSLKAQTTADMAATNTAVTNATVTNVTAAAVEAPQAPAVRIEPPAFNNDSFSFGKTLVAIMPFIFTVAFLAVIFYFKHRRNKLAHETVRMMIEKGVPVTPEIIASLQNKNCYEKYGVRAKDKTGLLLTGLILAGVGIGVIAVAGKPGLIVMFIGVAFLIVWFMESKKQNDQQPPKQ